MSTLTSYAAVFDATSSVRQPDSDWPCGLRSQGTCLYIGNSCREQPGTTGCLREQVYRTHIIKATEIANGKRSLPAKKK
jgi:hypothetical protein